VTRLVGHEEAVAEFRAGLASGRMHHAWLLAGPRGIGKASFAEAAALYLLADAAGPAFTGEGLEVPDDHPIAHLIRAGSHPDLRHLQRLERPDSNQQARNITIDQIRAIASLLGNTAALSPWRTVIIDALDDLERDAANALLKMLEEPPANTLFLLVSHAPGRLLPTIRSRCRILRFVPLGQDDMARAVRTALPEADEREIAALVRAGDGAPGRALHYAGLDLAAIDVTLEGLTSHGDPTNAERVRLAKALAVKSAQPRYEAFLARVPAHLAALARKRQGPSLAAALSVWEKARDLAGGAVRLSLDPQTTVFELAGLLATLAPDHSAHHG
jgi:DNA polymerase-3 subunit delta'